LSCISGLRFPDSCSAARTVTQCVSKRLTYARPALTLDGHGRHEDDGRGEHKVVRDEAARRLAEVPLAGVEDVAEARLGRADRVRVLARVDGVERLGDVLPELVLEHVRDVRV
jgi:hypothetical protein